jgi:hypothetical protein
MPDRETGEDIDALVAYTVNPSPSRGQSFEDILGKF